MTISAMVCAAFHPVLHGQHAQQTSLHGLRGVVDQIAKRALHGLGIGHDRRHVRSADEGAFNAVQPACEQRQRFFNDRIQIADFGCGGGKSASAEN